MSTYLLSPSETKLAEKLGESAIISTIPEEKGADILIYTMHGLFGIQRKEVPNDFLASVSDGRLTRETSLLPKACKYRLLLLEGRFKYWTDGRIAIPGMREPSSYTRKQVRGILFDAYYVKDVPYDYTDDIDDTVFYIRAIDFWFNKEKHLALFSRPSGPKGTWIVPSVEETQSWVLQGFEGIGPALATSILEHFGGLPLRWACSLEELVKVPKLSTKRATYLWNFLSKSQVAPVTGEPNEYERLRRMLSVG